MLEVTPHSIKAVPIVKEVRTPPGFVIRILALVFLKIFDSMSKLALLSISTISPFHKVFTEFTFEFFVANNIFLAPLFFDFARPII